MKHLTDFEWIRMAIPKPKDGGYYLADHFIIREGFIFGTDGYRIHRCIYSGKIPDGSYSLSTMNLSELKPVNGNAVFPNEEPIWILNDRSEALASCEAAIAWSRIIRTKTPIVKIGSEISLDARFLKEAILGMDRFGKKNPTEIEVLIKGEADGVLLRQGPRDAVIMPTKAEGGSRFEIIDFLSPKKG